MTEAREAWAPMPYWMRSVCPDTTRTRVVDAQGVRTDLRHCRRETLADRRAAGHQLDRAGRIDGDPGAVERPKPTLLNKDRDA
jgi:hypothetical protein